MSERRPASSETYNCTPVDWEDRHAGARAIVAWAGADHGGRLAMTSAFGLNGVALIHLVYEEVGLRVPVLFVDTGKLFPETLATRDRIVARYDIDLVETEPLGDHLPVPPESHCCEYRKVRPMRRLLAEVRPTALLTGRGRFQAATRRMLPLIEWRERPIRVNPLVYWTQAEVERYVQENNVPYNPLYDRGYYSVGCRPCTRAVREGEDVRAGRWDGLGKVECGLWR